MWKEDKRKIADPGPPIIKEYNEHMAGCLLWSVCLYGIAMHWKKQLCVWLNLDHL